MDNLFFYTSKDLNLTYLLFFFVLGKPRCQLSQIRGLKQREEQGQQTDRPILRVLLFREQYQFPKNEG